MEIGNFSGVKHMSQTFYLLNNVGSSSNLQEIFPIIYWHNLWFQKWPIPSSLHSGSPNVLKFPDFCQQLNHVGSSPNFQEISTITQGHDLWFQRWPIPSSLKSGTHKVLQVPNEGQQLHHVRSWLNFQDASPNLLLVNSCIFKGLMQFLQACGFNPPWINSCILNSPVGV